MTIHIEDNYLTVREFCRQKRYILRKLFIQKAENDLKKLCLEQDLLIVLKKNHQTNSFDMAFPQSVLEDFFLIWAN